MPKNFNKRNDPPACGQMKATDPFATSARDSVCAVTALVQSEQRTHRHVGYKNSVSRFHMLVMSRCYELHKELVAIQYKPERGVPHEVYEPKRRTTVSSKYIDRVPQASFIVNYFYPHIVPTLIQNNFACLKGRGVDKARETFRNILREADENDYVLKADMQKYFASIIHENLYEEMPIEDVWAQWFLTITVENTGSPVGLDLGSEVYQLSAGAFPNALDHMLDTGTYLRYQDDIIYVGTKTECLIVLDIIREETARLGLCLSKKKTFIQPVRNPVKFLGYSFWKRGRHVTMKRLPDKVRHEKRKLRNMKRKGVPMENVCVHYDSVRVSMKKGGRSGLWKLDQYFNSLFGGE